MPRLLDRIRESVPGDFWYFPRLLVLHPWRTILLMLVCGTLAVVAQWLILK